MNGTWIKRLRALHTWLSVFFAPLLLLFIITGWWQTFATDESRDKGAVNKFFNKLADVHTDDFFKHGAAEAHASHHFKIFVSCMAVTLIVSILLGLTLACQNARQARWAVLAFSLGVLIPALILYFN